MQIFDGHLHIDARSYNELETLVLCSVRRAVTLSYDIFKMSTKDVYTDQYYRLIHYERERAKKAGLTLYVGLGIHPNGIPKDVFDLLDELPDLLPQNGVVAVGETGITDPDSKMEREVLKAQMEIARDMSLPIVVDTPYEHKKRVFNRIVKVQEEVGIPPEQMLIDHLDPNLSKEANERGFITGISLWPALPFVRPENFLQALKFDEYDVDKLIISSDLCPYHNDPMALPKLVFCFESNGVSEDIMSKIFYENPARFYGIEVDQTVS